MALYCGEIEIIGHKKSHVPRLVGAQLRGSIFWGLWFYFLLKSV